jgi:hypothetical protein
VAQTNLLQALEWEPEASWAEDVSTFTKRAAILGTVEVSLKQDAIDPERAVQQLQGGTAKILGPKSGTIKFSVWATGHGSATSGAVTVTDHETLVGYGWGNPSLGEALSAPTRSAASGTTAGVGSTVSSVVTAASATFARGSLCRLGSSTANRTRGGGKFYAVSSHVGTALALRNDTEAALQSGDVVHSAVNFYFPETVAATACKGLRFRFLSADKKYIARGCWLQSMTLRDTNVGSRPRWDLEFGVSEWDDTSATFPTALTHDTTNPAPVCGGSIHVQDYGSGVRNERTARDFTVTITAGCQPVRGHNGVWPYQTYVGAIRTPAKVEVSWVESAADGHDTYRTKYEAGTAITIVASLSITSGSALGFHAHTARLLESPVQVANDGMNAVMLRAECQAGPDTTTELSQACAVVAYA